MLALLDDLGVERFALVGASYGGWVALQVATAAPERVERLVLLDTLAEVAEPDERLRAFWREEGALVDAGDLDAATDLNVALFLGPDASEDARELVWKMQQGVFEHQRAAGEVEGRELPVDPARLTMRTTVVAGAHDLPFFVTTARELARVAGRRADRAALGGAPAVAAGVPWRRPTWSASRDLTTARSRPRPTPAPARSRDGTGRRRRRRPG